MESVRNASVLFVLDSDEKEILDKVYVILRKVRMEFKINSMENHQEKTEIALNLISNLINSQEMIEEKK